MKFNLVSWLDPVRFVLFHVRNKKLLMSLVTGWFYMIVPCASAEWVLIESCGVLDGWHQTIEIKDGYKYVVDYFHCSNTATDSGDMCPNHPCLDCSSYYCAEGSEKYGWVESEKNLGGPPPDQCDTN